MIPLGEIRCPHCGVVLEQSAITAAHFVNWKPDGFIEDVSCSACGRYCDVKIQNILVCTPTEIVKDTCERCGGTNRSRYFWYRKDNVKKKANPWKKLCLACRANAVNGGEIEADAYQVGPMVAAEEKPTSRHLKYEVEIGGGCATGEVFVPADADDDQIRLAIMNNLYGVYYEDVKETVEEDADNE